MRRSRLTWGYRVDAEGKRPQDFDNWPLAYDLWRVLNRDEADTKPTIETIRGREVGEVVWSQRHFAIHGEGTWGR